MDLASILGCAPALFRPDRCFNRMGDFRFADLRKPKCQLSCCSARSIDFGIRSIIDDFPLGEILGGFTCKTFQ